jgi:hypothetical protein
MMFLGMFLTASVPLLTILVALCCNTSCTPHLSDSAPDAVPPRELSTGQVIEEIIYSGGLSVFTLSFFHPGHGRSDLNIIMPSDTADVGDIITVDVAQHAIRFGPIDPDPRNINFE